MLLLLHLWVPRACETPPQGIYLWGPLLHLSLLWQTYTEYILLCSEEHASCCGGACSQRPSQLGTERGGLNTTILAQPWTVWSGPEQFLSGESMAPSHTPQASGVYTRSCFHVVCVCTWWVRIGFAGCASPNVVSGQTGPRATHWPRPRTLQKTPRQSKATRGSQSIFDPNNLASPEIVLRVLE